MLLPSQLAEHTCSSVHLVVCASSILQSNNIVSSKIRGIMIQIKFNSAQPSPSNACNMGGSRIT